MRHCIVLTFSVVQKKIWNKLRFVLIYNPNIEPSIQTLPNLLKLLNICPGNIDISLNLREVAADELTVR